MTEKIVANKEDLVLIADALREKEGTTTEYNVPELSIAASDAIKNGGSNDNESFKGIIERIAASPTLPEDLTSIGDQVFTAYTALISLSIPSGVVSIGDYCFNSCSNLSTVTFEGTPNTISSTCFYNCPSLVTINVPWAADQVAGAPWGASNATINYNYVGQEDD